MNYKRSSITGKYYLNHVDRNYPRNTSFKYNSGLNLSPHIWLEYMYKGGPQRDTEFESYLIII